MFGDSEISIVRTASLLARAFKLFSRTRKTLHSRAGRSRQRGGTRGNISNSFVQAAKNSSNSAKFVSKLGGFASTTGTVLSYYGAATEFSNGSYFTGTSEAISSTISMRLASIKGNVVGLAWTIGWKGGRLITNTDFYEEWYRNTWHPYRFKTLGY